MRRQKLSFDNLGETLSAAKNASRLGTQQFETPPAVARALMLPLTPCRPVVADLECGHGALLGAAANETTRAVLGIDIDPTAFALPRGWKLVAPPAPRVEGTRGAASLPRPDTSVLHGDLQRLAPLLRETGWKADLFVLNPPFSLQWKDGDSTLVTWRLAQEFLGPAGEGLMLCNAATAERLILPDAYARRIWLHVTLPNFFPGTTSEMRIAALYFAADFEGEAHPVQLDTALPETLAPVLAALPRKSILARTATVRRAWDCSSNTLPTWRAVSEEWKRILAEEKGERGGWNIRLDAHGRIRAHLTPFQKLSGAVPVRLAEELHGLDGQYPSALVVQKPSRLALQRAVSGAPAIWRVHPDVTVAVEQAVRDYHAVRAPFIRLNAVQRIGYLDEEDEIACTTPGLEGFTPGRRYPLATETFEGRKLEMRARPGLPDEEVLSTGQELAIVLTDDLGARHCFTHYPPTGEDERPAAEHHHLLTDLAAHFDIPDVPDVATVNPELYAENLRRLTALEHAA